MMKMINGNDDADDDVNYVDYDYDHDCNYEDDYDGTKS